MDSQIKKFLYDIEVSLDSIENYLGEKKSFLEYEKNKMLRRAIERELEIIGEAITQVNKIEPDIKISSKSQIIGMRNRVIHGYDKIDNGIIWGTIIRHLPILKVEINKLLQQ